MKLFPSVTFDMLNLLDLDVEWFTLDQEAWYSQENGGMIWLRKMSAKILLHEFLHHLGYSLRLPMTWHYLIETIL